MGGISFVFRPFVGNVNVHLNSTLMLIASFGKT
jgi:hypothetical protein